MMQRTNKSKSRYKYAIGADPGLKGGALVFCSSDLVQFEFVDIKAISLEESTDLIPSVCWDLHKKYGLGGRRLVACVEDTNLFGGNQTGKATQLKNIGIVYAGIRTALSAQLEEGRNIRLVSGFEWKKHLKLDQTRGDDESANAYQVRKKNASKNLAVKILQDAGQVVWANKIAKMRSDFAEAFLMAIYALEPTFLDGHRCNVHRKQIAGSTLTGTQLIDEETYESWRIVCWDKTTQVATIEKLPGKTSIVAVDGAVTFSPLPCIR
jgi:hypothetical protein